MGLESRDYVREPPRGWSGGGGMAAPAANWAIKYLIIANAVVFVVDNAGDRVASDWLALRLSHKTIGETELRGRERRVLLPAGTKVQLVGVEDGDAYVIVRDGRRIVASGAVNADDVRLRYANFLQVWRFLTYGFCHGDFRHILFNMYALWLFGRLIEPILGSREFLWFYLAGILVSGLGFLVVTAVAQTSVLVGASGGVMAVTIATAMTYPRERVFLFFVVPVEFRWLAIGYVLLDLSGMVQGEGNVAHAAHLGGAAFGFLYQRYGWRIAPTGWPSWRVRWPTWRRTHGPKLRVHRPSREEMSERVDALLDKIRDNGEGSLSDEERAFLNEASRQYRNR